MRARNRSIPPWGCYIRSPLRMSLSHHARQRPKVQRGAFCRLAAALCRALQPVAFSQEQGDLRDNRTSEMKKSRFVAAQLILVGIVSIIFLDGCVTPFPASHTQNHAFIVYWPPPKESKRLRLAVKDVIDVKGVVTTAGSEYLAKISPPASADAECVAIARERGVQIVGKTNLSEFAVAPSGF